LSDTLALGYPSPSGCRRTHAAPPCPEVRCSMVVASCPTPGPAYPRLSLFPRFSGQPRPSSRAKNPRNRAIELDMTQSYNIVGGVPARSTHTHRDFTGGLPRPSDLPTPTLAKHVDGLAAQLPDCS